IFGTEDEASLLGMQRAMERSVLRRYEKGERPHLDTLTWRSACRSGGVDERSVGREPCATVDLRVVHLEDDRLVSLHLRKVEPKMVRVVAQLIGLAYALGISTLGR